MVVAAGGGTVEKMPEVHKDVWALVVQEEIEKPLLATISEEREQGIAKTNEITSLKAQIRALQHDCYTQNQEIEAKNQEIRAKGQRVSELERRYRTDDRAFSELRAKYEARKSSEEAKDRRITDLEHQHRADRQAFSDLRDEYEERKESDEAKIEAKSQLVSELQAKHEADDKALSDSRAEYEARKRSDKLRIRDRDNKYSVLEAEYESLQESCKAKDYEIQALRDRIGRRDDRVRDLEAESADLQEQLGKRDERILFLEGASSDNYDILQRKVREVDDLVILREQLLAVCHDNNFIMADRTGQISTLEDRVEDVLDELENLQNLVSTLQANAQYQVARYRNMERVVNARHRTIAERNLTITNLEDQARTSEGVHAQTLEALQNANNLLQNANNMLQSREQRLAEFVAAELGSDPASWMPFTQILSTCQHVPGIPVGDDRPWAILPAWISDEPVDESNPGSIFNICRQLFAGVLESHFGARQIHLFRLLAQGLVEDSVPVELVVHVIREFLRASEEKDVSMRRTFDYFYLVPLWQVADMVAFRWPDHSDAKSLCDKARSLVTRSYFAPFYELIVHGCDTFASELQQNGHQEDRFYCPDSSVGFMGFADIDDAFLLVRPNDRSFRFVLSNRGVCRDHNFHIKCPLGQGGEDVILPSLNGDQLLCIILYAGLP